MGDWANDAKSSSIEIILANHNRGAPFLNFRSGAWVKIDIANLSDEGSL